MTEYKLEPIWEKQDIEEGKNIATIGYLGFLCVVPYPFKTDNPFVKAHRGQQLLLAICYFIPILNFISVVWQTIGLIQAVNGNLWKMPILYDLARKLGARGIALSSAITKAKDPSKKSNNH